VVWFDRETMKYSFERACSKLLGLLPKCAVGSVKQVVLSHRVSRTETKWRLESNESFPPAESVDALRFARTMGSELQLASEV